MLFDHHRFGLAHGWWWQVIVTDVRKTIIPETGVRFIPVVETRAALPYNIWMMQRVLDRYHSMAVTEAS